MASAQATEKDGLLPGAWSQTFTLRLVDPSSQDQSGAPQTSTETDCYTGEDIADVQRLLLAGAEKDCSVSAFSMAGGKLSMATTCQFGPGMDFAGEFVGTYQPTSFDLHGVMRAKGNNPVSVEASMSARRVGDCRA